MSSVKNLKKIENLGWKAFEATGDINAYGMIVSSRELLQMEEQKEEQNNRYGM